MIKIQLGELLEVRKSIGELMSLQLPVKTSFKVKVLYDKLVPEFKAVETLINEAVKKYGEEDENKEFRVTETNMEEYKKEWDKITSTEVEIDVVPFKLDDFNGVRISAGCIYNMGKLIEE